MIMDFSRYTNSGLQSITYHNKNSLADYGVVLSAGTKTSELTAKSIVENIPYTDGQHDLSDIGGGINYDYRTLTYRFKIFAENAQKLREKESQIKSWLNSDGDHKICDNDYDVTVGNVTTQWLFEKCVLKNIEVEEGEEKSSDVVYEYLTATFECTPYMLKQGSVNDRVFKFADTITGNNTATIAVNNSSYTITKSTGTTMTGTLPSGDRKYRIICYSENIPTITLGNTAITPDEVFTLPASGTITISGTGYAYIELWHDTREVRL